MIGALDAAAMLARAQAETGLDDYGDPTLPERFTVGRRASQRYRHGRQRH